MTRQFLLHPYNFNKTGHLCYCPPSTPKRMGFGFALFGFSPLGLVWVFSVWFMGDFGFKQLNSKFCKQIFVQISKCSLGLHMSEGLKRIKLQTQSPC